MQILNGNDRFLIDCRGFQFETEDDGEDDGVESEDGTNAVIVLAIILIVLLIVCISGCILYVKFNKTMSTTANEYEKELEAYYQDKPNDRKELERK